jgi:hypothetical protein
MLVASRDPFHPGANNMSSSQGVASRFGRAMGAVQIIGTLLAIPVGIGSAITMYRANFSAETTCQSLRANIVAMLDKSVDATARHMLVRRDVATFEATCRTVDPDAVAAFTALLAADRKAAAPVAPAVARIAEPKPEAGNRKAELRPDFAAKEKPVKSTIAVSDAAPAQREASDAIWIDAVRRALGAPAADAPAAEINETAVKPAIPAQPAKPTLAIQTPAVAPPVPREIHPALEAQTPAAAVTPPQAAAVPALAPISVPTLAPAAPAPPLSIVPAQAAQEPRQDSHPVPPGSIPDPAPVEKAEVHAPSRLGALAARIPLVGWAFDR